MTRYKKILEILKDMYPDATCELNHSNAYELLVATILSAQSTDKRVNIVTSDLFKKYNTPDDMVALGEEKLAKLIKSIGFYNSKAKNIIEMSRILIEKFDFKVPDNMEDLLSLPGVGRKTANVVLSNAFDVPAIAVDTHVYRVSHRLGFSKGNTPELVEIDLMKKIPKKDWSLSHHVFIFHGRRTCKARNPLCDNCEVKNFCYYYKGLD
ncbi:endonuclease-3 [Acetoanaerobium pronyense]|uniref:Endonuclease III n=1 Tax=Acetoanaerobium pronyense TaxID=1482736 RepID=A0ABS4KIM9_9FIRM|nr:endonuclease III [Acetoanaerobium pronyense]MBP2026986.1 endonuclease-3 [Acetoanaerobium pronyense]